MQLVPLLFFHTYHFGFICHQQNDIFVCYSRSTSVFGATIKYYPEFKQIHFCVCLAVFKYHRSCIELLFLHLSDHLMTRYHRGPRLQVISEIFCQFDLFLLMKNSIIHIISIIRSNCEMFLHTQKETTSEVKCLFKTKSTLF